MDKATAVSAREFAPRPKSSKTPLHTPRDSQQIGIVTAVSGSKLSFALLNSTLTSAGHGNYEQAQVGALVKISTPTTAAFGFIESIAFQRASVNGAADSVAIAKMDFPVYGAGGSAPLNLAIHHAVDLNVPIGCGGVAVFPGDVIVGDGEGVVVIPRHLADEVAAKK